MRFGLGVEGAGVGGVVCFLAACGVMGAKLPVIEDWDGSPEAYSAYY